MRYISYRLIFCTLFLIVLTSAMSSSVLAEDELTPVRQSSLASIDLPAGAARIGESSIPAEVNAALEKLVAAGGDKVRQGAHEVLAWTEGFKK
ncbi:MAG TPA: hypothetical protein VHQ01_09610, partial [Pyrinomonadaceae bacterium]|nr:hypothetical protein [Pyrinomonadaceae bacterium]